MKPMKALNALHPDKTPGTTAYARRKKKFVPTKLVGVRRCGMCGVMHSQSFEEHLSKCVGLGR